MRQVVARNDRAALELVRETLPIDKQQSEKLCDGRLSNAKRSL